MFRFCPGGSPLHSAVQVLVVRRWLAPAFGVQVLVVHSRLALEFVGEGPSFQVLDRRLAPAIYGVFAGGSPLQLDICFKLPRPLHFLAAAPLQPKVRTH